MFSICGQNIKNTVVNFCRIIPDSLYLRLVYRLKTGNRLNLKNPQTFNEKLQWLKLHDRNPLYTTLVDKCEVKKYVAEKIGKEYIIPTLGVWERFDDIDFDSLPNQFVLKCTHDSGSVVICRDKADFDIAAARKKLSAALKRNYYWLSREWPYKNVTPRIIAEQFLSDIDGSDSDDYKVMCFGGEPKYVQVHKGRFTNHTQDFFTVNWEKTEIHQDEPCAGITIEQPANLEEMLAFSKLLADKIPQVRIDWYNVRYKLYFGEITFFDGGGLEEFKPDDWNKILGKLIQLPVNAIHNSGGGRGIK